MSAFLVAEEGPFAGMIIRLDEGDEWILGRDPDVCFQVIEDPMVSRKHLILRIEEDAIVVENLSAVNPASVNGAPIEEPIALSEGDMLKIGSGIFRFTEKAPKERVATEEETETSTIFDEGDRLDAFSFTSDYDSRWLLKVTAGPNTGAEFSIATGSSHVVGKDPHECDIVFQDLSVSKRHARLFCDENDVLAIEDLKSKNGIAVNGRLVHEPKPLASQDAIVIGTTHLLVVDKAATQDTVVSPPPLIVEETAEEQKSGASEWKATLIPRRHLYIAGVFAVMVLFVAGGLISLFSGRSIVIEQFNAEGKIQGIVAKFPEVKFSYAKQSGKLFLLGNVLSETDHQELVYLLEQESFITSIEDNVIIDELVWENLNAMLMKYPDWRGVFLTSSKPGDFVLRGYVETPEQAAKLADWLNTNFSFTNRLVNNVVDEQSLQTEVQAIILAESLPTVTFELANGQVTLSGRVPGKEKRQYTGLVEALKRVNGIQEVRSFVAFTKNDQEFIDISQNYKVTGSSKLGDISQFVVINGKILSSGEELDGMTITSVKNTEIYLEKDGLKYKINYNQQ